MNYMYIGIYFHHKNLLISKSAMTNLSRVTKFCVYFHPQYIVQMLLVWWPLMTDLNCYIEQIHSFFSLIFSIQLKVKMKYSTALFAENKAILCGQCIAFWILDADIAWLLLC